jgi:hypothetical protein
MRHTLSIIGAAALATLTGCAADTHGVLVTNQTDRIVRAELILLRKDGEMTTYSTQTLSPGAEFKNMVDGDERRRGMRVRFSLSDQKIEDANWVMLNLPTKEDRIYDLLLLGPRLTAREFKKGLKPKVEQ